MAPFSLIAGATRPQRSGAAPHEPAVRRTSNKAAPSIRGSAPPATASAWSTGAAVADDGCGCCWGCTSGAAAANFWGSAAGIVVGDPAGALCAGEAMMLLVSS